MSASEPVVFSAADIVAILRTSLWVGVGSPKYSHLPTGQVIQKYAEFIVSRNFTFEPEELTENFGTKPPDVPLFIKQLGGMQNMVEWLPAVAEVRSFFPHPRNPQIVTPLFIAFTVMTTISVVLRMLSRHRVGGGLRSFDWLTFAAYLMTVIWGGVAVYHSSVVGEYEAWWDRSWDMLRENYRVVFVLNALYPWVMMVIKLSLCMFYYRMTNMNYMRWGVWITAFITIGNTIAGFFVPIFQCKPVAYWDYLLENPCRPNEERRTAAVAIGAIYILTDVIIWALPMPMLFKLKLYPKQRLLAFCTFGIGSIACIASGFRLDSVMHLIYSSENSSGLLIDAWTIIEMNIALICACAPAVRALIIFYAPKVLSRANSSAASKPSVSKKTVESKNTVESKKTVDVEKAELEKPEPETQVTTVTPSPA